jgi:hypothetical protein
MFPLGNFSFSAPLRPQQSSNNIITVYSLLFRLLRRKRKCYEASYSEELKLLSSKFRLKDFRCFNYLLSCRLNSKDKVTV